MSGRTACTFDGVLYAPGRRFRVVAEGVRLSGLVPVAGGGRGWSGELPVGTVVTCLGYGPGWGSDPGSGVEFSSEAGLHAGAAGGALHPGTGTAFDRRPAPGLLEALPEAEQDLEHEMAAAAEAEAEQWRTLRRSLTGRD